MHILRAGRRHLRRSRRHSRLRPLHPEWHSRLATHLRGHSRAHRLYPWRHSLHGRLSARRRAPHTGWLHTGLKGRLHTRLVWLLEWWLHTRLRLLLERLLHSRHARCRHILRHPRLAWCLHAHEHPFRHASHARTLRDPWHLGISHTWSTRFAFLLGALFKLLTRRSRFSLRRFGCHQNNQHNNHPEHDSEESPEVRRKHIQK